MVPLQQPKTPPKNPLSLSRRTNMSNPTDNGVKRKVGITIDCSDASEFAVRWAIDNYIKPGDDVIVLFVYLMTLPRLKDIITMTVNLAARPLSDAKVPHTVRVAQVEKQDMDKHIDELVCSELNKLGLNVVIMCSRRHVGVGGLGRVTGYCAQNCTIPAVVLVRPPEPAAKGSGTSKTMFDFDDKGTTKEKKQRMRLLDRADREFESQKRKGGSGGGYWAKRAKK